MKRLLPFMVLLSLGCPQAAKDVTDGAALAVCILNHSSETPAQIEKDCQGATQQAIQDVLLAHRAATEREMSRGKLTDGGAPAADGGK